MACCGGTLQMCFCQSPLVDTPWRLSRSTSICGGSVSTSSSSVHSTRGPQGSPELWEGGKRFAFPAFPQLLPRSRYGKDQPGHDWKASAWAYSTFLPPQEHNNSSV